MKRDKLKLRIPKPKAKISPWKHSGLRTCLKTLECSYGTTSMEILMNP